MYIENTGVGVRQGPVMSMSNIRDGDAILVSGPVGDHGIAVMLAREAFGLRGDIRSDAASVLELTSMALTVGGLRFIGDPTRGGLATVCAELHRATSMGVRLIEDRLPIRDAVQSVCDMLGYDPMYLACEGRVVAVVALDEADALLRSWQAIDNGRDAAIIGHIDAGLSHVTVSTAIGGERILEELEDDPLPRIC